MYFPYRKRLIDAREEAKRANPGVFLVDLSISEEAILRSMTELQPKGTVRMPVPYREGCAYTFTNGELHLQAGMSVRLGLTCVVATRNRDLCNEVLNGIILPHIILSA